MMMMMMMIDKRVLLSLAHSMDTVDEQVLCFDPNKL